MQAYILAIFQVFTSIVTISIALIVYFHSRKVSHEQSKSMLLTSINNFNSLALSNDKCLETCDRLITGQNATLDEARERWAIFSILNNRQLHFFAYIHGQNSKEYIESDAKQILDPLLKNGKVIEVIKTGGYDPRFINYCLQRMNQIKKEEK